jgi:hypothetical protein
MGCLRPQLMTADILKIFLLFNEQVLLVLNQAGQKCWNGVNRIVFIFSVADRILIQLRPVVRCGLDYCFPYQCRLILCPFKTNKMLVDYFDTQLGLQYIFD